MARTAEVIYVGDAASLIKASREASTAVETSTAKIKASSDVAGSGFLSMSGAGKKAASELESAGGRMGSALGGIASSGNLAIAAIAGVGIAVAGIKKSADTLEEIGKVTLKLHNQFGLTAESASAFASVAKVNNINSGALTTSFTKLSTSVQAVDSAHQGLTKSAKTQEVAFKLLGLPLSDIYKAHGDLNKILPEVIDKFEHLQGSTKRGAVAQALFGRGAKELVPLMHAGALGLKEQLEEAQKMGATLSGTGVNSLKQFMKAQEDAKYASLGLQLAIGQYVAPALTGLITTFAHAVAEIRSGSGKIGRDAHAIGQAFSVAASIVGPVVGGIIHVVEGMATSISGVVTTIKGVLTLNFSEAWSGVKTIFQGGIKAAIGAVEAAVGPFKHIGEMLAKGFAEGIEAGVSWVKHAGEAIANAPGELVEKAINAKSPSKVFEGHGLNVALGFAAGITKGHQAVAAAASAMGSVPSQIVAFFEGKGFSHAAAAGIAGNAGQESSYNPNAPGGGLFQTIGGRGVPQGSSVNAQLESAYREMVARGEVSGLKHATDPAAAARSFESTFERAGIPALSKREAFAREAYASTSGRHPETVAVSSAAKQLAAAEKAHEKELKALEAAYKKWNSAWDGAIKTVKSAMGELVSKATAAFSAVKLSAATGGLSSSLAGKHAEDEAESRRQTEESNGEALATAKQHVAEAKGNENPVELREAEHEQRRAEEAITAFARQQDEKRTESAITAAEAAVQAETDAYRHGLEAQTALLVSELEHRQITIARFAEESTRMLGSSPAVPSTLAQKGPGSGAPIITGETGQKSSGASVHVAGNMIVGSRRDAHNLAHSLAHKLQYGGH